MPFKSQAQRAKFAEMLKQGKISQKTFDEWNKSSEGKALPKRLHPSRKRDSNDRK